MSSYQSLTNHHPQQVVCLNTTLSFSATSLLQLIALLLAKFYLSSHEHNITHCVALVSHCRETWLAGLQRPKSGSCLYFMLQYRFCHLQQVHLNIKPWGKVKDVYTIWLRVCGVNSSDLVPAGQISEESVPCSDQVGLTEAKGHERVKPAVFSWSEEEEEEEEGNILLVCKLHKSFKSPQPQYRIIVTIPHLSTPDRLM